MNRKVTDTRSLVSQIKSDPVVADRYQRHFGMTRQEVLTYVGTLHRAPLKTPGSFTIYSVPDDGHVKMHVAKLKKGEPMFVDASESPILIAKCGNPVVMGPSQVRRGNPVALVPTDDSSTRELGEVPRDALVENPNDLVAMVPPVPEVVPPVIVPVTPVEAAPMTMVPVTATGGGGGINFPFLAGLPLLLPFISGGDNGGGGTQAVPEPATMVALGIGAVGLMRRRRRA